MANTYAAIATVTVGSGGASSIEFTSIPQTYTDLCILVSGRGSASAYYSTLGLQFNSSTSNWTNKWVQSYGSGVNSGSAANNQIPDITGNTATASTFGNMSIYITNYTSSKYKSVLLDSVTENNATSAQAQFYVDSWANTAAITSIKLQDPFSGYTFLQYSTATLYGISNS
jgi:hypothetical protein